MQLQSHDGHRAELESFLELLDVCEVSNHVAQPNKEGLQIGIDVYVLSVFSLLSFLEFLLVLQSLRWQFILTRLFEVLDIDAFLLSLVDLLHTLAAIYQV